MKVEIPFDAPLDLGQPWVTYRTQGYGIYLNPGLPYWFVFPESSFEKVLPVLSGEPLSSIWDAISGDELEWLAWQYQLLVSMRHEEQGAEHIPPLSSVHFYATRRCNLKCTHCYMNAGSDKTEEDEIPLSYVEFWLDGLLEQRPDIKSFNISGGEPLLREGISCFCSKLKEKDRYVCLLTNATLISEQNVGPISESVDYVQLSIDGASPGVHDSIRGSNSFKKTMRAIELLAALDCTGIGISICLMPANLEDFRRNLGTLIDRLPGWVDISFGKAKLFGRADSSCKILLNNDVLDEIDDLLEATGLSRGSLASPRRYLGCGYGRNLVIDANGDIYPCVFPFNCYANICKNPPMETLDLARQVYVNNIVDRYAVCRSCSVRYLCRGQCRLQNLDTYGTLIPHCRRERQLDKSLRMIIKDFKDKCKFITKKHKGKLEKANEEES